MPTTTYTQHLRQLHEPYADYDYRYQTNSAQLDLVEYLENFNPELYKKLKNAINAYNNTLTDDVEHPKKTKKEKNPALEHLNKVGGSAETIVKLRAVQDDVRNYMESVANSTREPEKNYSDFFRLISIQTDFNRDGYSYVKAAYDNPILSCLPIISGSGPLFTSKRVNGKKVPTDLAKLEAELRKPDGKGYFEPYMKLCKATVDLWNLEFEKQKNDSYGWTPDSYAAFKEKYKTALTDFTKSFRDLSEAVKAHGDLYQKGVHLNNDSDQITGVLADSTRDLNFVVGNMEGQIKALENGWGIDDLYLLGAIGQQEASNEKSLKFCELCLSRDERELKKHEAEKKDLQEQLKLYQETAASRALSIAEYKTQNADLIAWYDIYSLGLKQLEDSHAEKSVIDSYKNEYAVGLTQWNAYQDSLNELTLEPEIKKLKSKLSTAENKLHETQESIEKNRLYIENKTKIRAGIATLKDKVWNKKINNLNDKKEVLREYNAFMDSFGDLVIGNDNDTFKNHLFTSSNSARADEAEERLTTGFDDFIRDNKFVSEKIAFDMDFYGPDPAFQSVWETRNVISKKDFDDYIKPYDENARKLPFTKLEMTYLGMAGTFMVPDVVKEKYRADNTSLTGEQLIRKNASLWMQDISLRDDGPREGISTFKTIIKAGREKAIEAMTEYQNGNKAPVAELCYQILSYNQRAYDTATSFSANSAHLYGVLSTMTNMLRNDPELMNEFSKCNETRPEKERVDLIKISRMQSVAKTYSEAMNDQALLKDYRAKYPQLLHQWEEEFDENEMVGLKADAANKFRRYTLGAIRLDLLNFVQVTSDKYLKALPHTIDLSNSLVHAVESGEDINLATYNALVATEDASKMSGFLYDIATPAGLREFDDFCDRMSDKYGIVYDEAMSKPTINGLVASESREFMLECEKYSLKCENKKILADLGSGASDVEKRTELITSYLINNHQMFEIDKALETGITKGMVDKTSIAARKYYDKNKLYMENIKKYVENMDYSSLKPGELAELLKSGETTLNEICCDIEVISDNSLYSNPEKASALHFTSLTEGINRVTAANRNVYKGTKQYSDILDNLTKLESELAANEESLKHGNPKVYDSDKLVAKEKKLLEDMDIYLKRKNDEKNAGKGSATADRRIAAVKAARALLKRRYEEDIFMPNLTAENIKEASATLDTVNNAIEKRNDKAEITGAEILQAAIEEEEYKRKQFTDKVNRNNVDAINNRSKIDELNKSVKSALYLQTLKDALSPNNGDNELQIKTKDNLIKEKLAKDIDPGTDKTLDKIIGSKFGTYLCNQVLAKAIDTENSPAENMRHENIIVLRDNALRKCFRDAMSPKNGNKAADVREILDIAKSLGSKELSREAKKFEDTMNKAKEAKLGKAAKNEPKMSK